MDRRFWLGFAAYLLPTFALGYLWHLVLFAPAYHALAIYRDDILVPLGFGSMVVQGVFFSWLYRAAFAGSRRSWLVSGLGFGLAAAFLAWSFTTLAVAAKHVMTSVPDFLAIETAFTLVQFAVVGPLIALAYRRPGHSQIAA